MVYVIVSNLCLGSRGIITEHALFCFGFFYSIRTENKLKIVTDNETKVPKQTKQNQRGSENTWVPFCDGWLTLAHQVPSSAFEAEAPPPWPPFSPVTSSLVFFAFFFPPRTHLFRRLLLLLRTSSVSWSACPAGFVPPLDGKQMK